MKVGIITIFAALLLALPAFAGTAPPTCAEDNSGLPDGDTDGVRDECDNCDAVANTAQLDGDQDGFGDVCDCEFSDAVPQNNTCDGPDFTAFVQTFGTSVPPTNCQYEVARPANATVDGPDFTAFVLQFGGNPGPACGNGVGGGACADPGAPCP